MKNKNRKRRSALQDKARSILLDPQFLYKAGQKIGQLGLVVEERNRLVILLAGIARTLREPPSVLVKGSTSSGKSTLVKKSILLFPPNCIIERAGLSGKALAYGGESLRNKILFINEYRCGKDSQLLLRLLQSEGRIKHESTSIRGARRGTRTMERVGTPVVLTTTTDNKVFADDETRFQSLWQDESPDQTLAILTAQAVGDRGVKVHDLPVWRAAMSLVTARDEDFRDPPAWLRYIAHQLPLSHIRVRRDWNKFLTFCQAVALCRRFQQDSAKALEISFADYCVAYRLLEPVLCATMQGVNAQEAVLGKSVATLSHQLGRGVTVQEVAEDLSWKPSLVYKQVKRALLHRVVSYEPGIREKNIKRLLANSDAGRGFLPSPVSVFSKCPELGKDAKYIDPLTGKQYTIRRKKNN